MQPEFRSPTLYWPLITLSLLADRRDGGTAGAEESGAWLLLCEVAAQDSAAICWKFLGVLSFSSHCG